MKILRKLNRLHTFLIYVYMWIFILDVGKTYEINFRNAISFTKRINFYQKPIFIKNQFSDASLKNCSYSDLSARTINRAIALRVTSDSISLHRLSKIKKKEKQYQKMWTNIVRCYVIYLQLFTLQTVRIETYHKFLKNLFFW